jgi:hypothetical protein
VSGVWPKPSRRFFDGPFLRFRTRPVDHDIVVVDDPVDRDAAELVGIDPHRRLPASVRGPALSFQLSTRSELEQGLSGAAIWRARGDADAHVREIDRVTQPQRATRVAEKALGVADHVDETHAPRRRAVAVLWPDEDRSLARTATAT